MQDGRYPLGDLKASWLYGIDCPQRPLVSTCFNYIIYNYIFTHARTHTHGIYIYIYIYVIIILYIIYAWSNTHIYMLYAFIAIRTHTYIRIYIYIYIIYIITVCLMFISGMLKIICDTPCHLTVSHRAIFTRMGSENGSFPSTDPMDSHNCSIFYPIEHGYELVLPWWMGNKIPSHDWGFG